MRLTILSAKTYHSAGKALIESLKAVDQTDLGCRHVVVSNVKTSMSSEFSVLDALGGSFNTAVTTFARLTEQLLPGKNFISKQSAVMILTKIIFSLKDEFTCFKASALTPGFAETMYETISQFKYNNIKPDDLQKDSLPPGLKEKIRDIKLIYQAYEEFGEGKFADGGAKMRMLAEAVPESGFIRNSHFYIKDFDCFTVQEALIIRQLVIYSKGVTAAVVFSGRPEHRSLFLNEAYYTLLNVADGLGVKPEIIRAPDTVSGISGHILENLFAAGGPPKVMAAVPDKLALHSAGNIFDEAERAAGFIKQKTAEGVRYKDFLVVAGDMEKYAYAVAQAFGEYGLSFFLDRKKCLFDHALSRFILSALEMKRSGFARRETVGFIKNGLFAAAGSDLKFEFENYCLKYNVKYCSKPFEAGKDSEPRFRELERLRRSVADAVKNLETRTAPAADYIASVRGFLAAQKTEENLAALIAAQRDAAPGESGFSEQVWEKLDTLLNNMAAILGDMRLTCEAYAGIFESGLKSVKISLLPLYNDCIVVSELGKARAQAHKHLIVLGANDGVFPLVKSDTKLISDRNITELEKHGISIYPKVKIENRRERFNAYQLFCEPRESVYVSFLISDEDRDKAMLPSAAAEEIISMFSFEGKTPYPVFLAGGGERVYSKKHARRLVAAGMRGFYENPYAAAGAQRISELSAALGEDTAGFAYRAETKKNIAGAGKYLLPKNAVSVTRIETFFACPYKYYWQNGVRLKIRPEGELRMPDIGNIFHEVFEKFVRGLIAGESGAEAEARAGMDFDAVAGKPGFKEFFNANKSGFFFNRLKKEAVSSCLKIKNQIDGSDFKPAALEWAFGFDDKNEFVIDTPQGAVKLNGKIDRVDVNGDKFILIDYKSGTGEVKFCESGLYEGRILQLPVYVKAFAEKTGLRPAGFYYLQTYEKYSGEAAKLRFDGRTLADLSVIGAIDKTAAGGKSALLDMDCGGGKLKKPDTVAAGQINAILDYADMLIRKAASALEDGVIADLPREGACGYCDFKAGCEYEDLGASPPRKEFKKVTADDLAKIVSNREPQAAKEI